MVVRVALYNGLWRSNGIVFDEEPQDMPCLFCGGYVERRTRNAVYCSPVCRVAAHHEKEATILSTKRVAELSRKSRHAVKRAADKRRLECVNLDGGRRVYTLAAVERWLNSCAGVYTERE